MGIESIEAEVKSGLHRFDEESLTDERVEEILSQYTDEGHNARYCLQNYKKLVSESVNIPVIASGGAGCLKDFYDAFTSGKADA